MVAYEENVESEHGATDPVVAVMVIRAICEALPIEAEVLVVSRDLNRRQSGLGSWAASFCRFQSVIILNWKRGKPQLSSHKEAGLTQHDFGTFL